MTTLVLQTESSSLLLESLSHFRMRLKGDFRVSSYHSFLDALVKLQNATISPVISVCLSTWNNSAQAG